MDRPFTRVTLNRPITNNALDTSRTKTTSTPRAGGLAKPGHAASICEKFQNSVRLNTPVIHVDHKNCISYHT